MTLLSNKMIEDENLSFHYSSHKRIKYTKGNIDAKLLISQTVIYELLNDQFVISTMHKFGYTPEKTEQFSSIYEAASSASIYMNKAQGDKVGAYSNFKKLYDSAKEDFKHLQKAAVLALRNLPKKMDDLRLKSKKGASIADIFIYLEFFYSLALSDEEILSALALYGYPKERLTKFYASLLECKEAYKTYTTQHAAAVEATRIRDLKIKELDSWMYEYFTMAKIASATIGSL